MRQPSISQWVLLVVHPLLAGISSLLMVIFGATQCLVPIMGREKRRETIAECLKDDEMY